MAAEQGWLADPRRFLILCTVFGGIPRHWERFHQEQAALPQPEAGFPAWRAAFLAREIERIEADSTERWDWKGWVEIKEVCRITHDMRCIPDTCSDLGPPGGDEWYTFKPGSNPLAA